MTDEATFQAALDAEPDNHAMRLVFADWLEEAGDWRAAGYRWMGNERKFPRLVGRSENRTGCAGSWAWYRICGKPDYKVKHKPAAQHVVPAALFQQMRAWRTEYPFRLFGSRREAEEALCKAVAAAAR